MAPQDQRIWQTQNGNLEAFNELVLIYQDRVFRQALWMLNDEAAAQDVCQEAFLHAYRKIGTFHGGPFRPWLLRITTNLCLDQIYAARRHPCQPLDAVTAAGEEIEPDWARDPGDSPETIAERTQTGDILAQSIQKLAPEFRVVVILVDIQELDYAEASTILHIPLGTLKSRLARARLKLREDLRAFSFVL